MARKLTVADLKAHLEDFEDTMEVVFRTVDNELNWVELEFDPINAWDEGLNEVRIEVEIPGEYELFEK